VNWEAAKRLTEARDGGKCLRCLGVAQDVHHRLVRGMGGSKAPAVAGLANLVSLCRICHDWVHGHPGEAYKAGWLVGRSTVPANAPIRLSAGEWLWLADDGSTRWDGRCARF
jgi:5-methylcytosine-specific restriction protein A